MHRSKRQIEFRVSSRLDFVDPGTVAFGFLLILVRLEWSQCTPIRSRVFPAPIYVDVEFHPVPSLAASDKRTSKTQLISGSQFILQQTIFRKIKT